jgi:hypothetical protein
LEQYDVGNCLPQGSKHGQITIIRGGGNMNMAMFLKFVPCDQATMVRNGYRAMAMIRKRARLAQSRKEPQAAIVH